MRNSGTAPAPEALRGLRVAVLGLRGIPATWGGVERQCEELYTRLAAQGLDVTVYARKGYVTEDIREYRGVRIVRLGTLPAKHLEAFVHSFSAALHLALCRADIVHVYSQGPALTAPLLRLTKPRAKIFFTCGGLDWQRDKWSAPAKAVLRLGEICSARCTDVRVMVSRFLQEYYERVYGRPTLYIPNGVTMPKGRPRGDVRPLGLEPGRYLLFVGRLVPEKRIQDLLAAFLLRPRGLKLALVGDAAGSEDYVQELKALAAGSEGVVFTGYRFGEELAALFANARCYVTASGLEGMPLTLLEAMSYGLPCLASDIAQHLEPLGDTGRSFPVGDVQALAGLLDAVEAAEPAALAEEGARCAQRVEREFTWDRAAASLAAAYAAAVGR